MVYLPMCYLYCSRFSPPELAADPVLLSLRRELFLEDEDFATIRWDAFRQTCAAIDEYSPLNPVMKVAQDLMAVYENSLLPRFSFLRGLRLRALRFVEDYIHAEDEQTNYVCIGPVNKALNMLSVWAADRARHAEAQAETETETETGGDKTKTKTKRGE